MGNQLGVRENTTKDGIWLVITDGYVQIHPVKHNTEVPGVWVYHIKIKGNTVSLSERVRNRYLWCSDKDSALKRGLYCVDILCYRASDSTDNIIWKDCTRYNVSDNTALKTLVEMLAACYDISSCALTGNNAKNICEQYSKRFSEWLKPYGISLKMTEQSCLFYLNNAPVALEPVVKAVMK